MQMLIFVSNDTIVVEHFEENVKEYKYQAHCNWSKNQQQHWNRLLRIYKELKTGV